MIAGYDNTQTSISLPLDHL